MTSICRIYTDTLGPEDLLAVMEACISLKFAFYYSGVQGIVRAETRSDARVRRLERELKARRIKYNKTYYR